MDSLCRVCIKKAAKWTSLNTKIVKSSSLSFFDFLNKCTSINACERDNLPQSLCSICTHRIKTFYSFVKLAENSDTILREALDNSISTGKHTDNGEFASEEIVIKNEKIEEASEDFNKEDSFDCQTGKNSTGSSLYILDIVKEEPCVSESTSIADFQDAEIDESDKFPSNLDYLEGSFEEPDGILSCIGGDIASIDVQHSVSKDDERISLLKKRLVKNENETDFQSNFLSKAHFIFSNVKKKTGKIKAKSKEAEVIKEEDPHSSSDDLICVICHRVFKTKIEYENHIRIEHGNRKQVSNEDIPGHTGNTYKCVECDIVFNDSEEFRTHCRNHIKGNKHDCNICGKKFVRYGDLYNHLANHEEKRKYKCSICGKGFKRFSARSRHMIMHSGKKPFECEICSKKFSSKYYLNVHIENHNGIIKKCDQCDKEFKNRDTLSRHMKWHLNPEPFKCEKCSKRFKSKQYLSVHMENHNGIKKKCDHCGKEFKNSDTLKRHKKWHVNPKVCANCGRAFSRKVSLTKHMEVCKPICNSNEETVTIQESSSHSKGNKDIIVKVTQCDVNRSYESAEVPITQFYEVRELEEDNNSDELTSVCVKKVVDDSPMINMHK